MGVPDLPKGGGGDEPPRPLETTAALISRARNGDERARTALVRRFTPAVRASAHGQLPGRARDRQDTDDLVQIAFTRALFKLNGFEDRGPGAFLAYVRKIVRRLVLTEYRKGLHRPPEDSLLDADAGAGGGGGAGTPLDEIAGVELESRYLDALSRLNEDQQVAVSLYVSWDPGLDVIMEAIDSPSLNAARMVLARGLVKLVKEMGLGEEEKDSRQ